MDPNAITAILSGTSLNLSCEHRRLTEVFLTSVFAGYIAMGYQTAFSYQTCRDCYLTHLQNLECSKYFRAKVRQEEVRAKKQKSLDDYDWAAQLEQGKRGTLTVPALDKYIKHHSLPNKGKNQDSMHMRCIALHLPAGNEHIGPQDNIQEEVEEEIEEKVVLAEVDSDDN